MASYQHSALLRLPAELRMMIYDFYLESLQHSDAFDTANRTTFWSHEPSDLHNRTSYSLIFAHPTVFAEAFPEVVKRLPSVFYNVQDLVHFGKEHPALHQALKHVALDLGKCRSRQMKSAIRSVSGMRHLRGLVIYVPKALWTAGIALPMAVCRYCNFQSLILIEVIDQGAKRKKEREYEQTASEERALAAIEEALGRLNLDTAVDQRAELELLADRRIIETSRLQRKVKKLEEGVRDMFRSTPAKRLEQLNKSLCRTVWRMQDARPEGPCRCLRPKSVSGGARGRGNSSVS